MISLPPSLWFPLRGERDEKTEKKNAYSVLFFSFLLCCGRFHSLAVAFRNTKARREGETKWPNRQQRSKTFLKNNIKTKHQSLTSLAFMRVVPGADRVIRHICNIYFQSPSRTDKRSRNDTTVMIRPHVPNWHIGTSRHDPSRIDTSLATRYGSGVLDYREKVTKTNCTGGCRYLQVMSHKRFSIGGISCCH